MIRVTEAARPELTIDAATFREHAEDGRYWNVPRSYFTVSGRTVYLDGHVAAKLEWNIDEDLGQSYNVNTYAQRIELDGETIDINPGGFCSYISKQHVRES